MIASDRVEPDISPIQLAHAADFDIGAIRVRPALREIECAGRKQRLEPRIMQVLVALAEAEGAVLSRNVLIARCWGGVVVGEDAINRAMLKIRRLSEIDGGRSFTLETVPRVGYRLVPATAAAPQPGAVLKDRALELARNRWGFAAAAAVAAVIAAAFAVTLSKSGESYAIDSIEMVAQTRRSEMHPTISPDGRFIVYAVSDGGGVTASDLYMRSLSGGEEMQLTDAPDLEIAPAFSPTGDRLAYVQVPSNGGAEPTEPCRIMLRVFPSGLERQVGMCEANSWVSRLAWTADGRALIYNDQRLENAGQGPDELRILDLESGRAESLVPPPAAGIGDYNANVSPDGRSLAFVRHSALGIADVFVFDFATRSLRQITRGEPVLHVAWAPDSRRLFVISETAMTTQLSLRRADGRGEVQRYVLGPNMIFRPIAARGLLAFELHSRIENLVRAGAEEPAAVTSGNQIDYGADYSIDGVLAFISAQSDVWLYLQPQGEPARRLAALTDLNPRGPRWSPDGRRIVFAGTEAGRSGLYIIDADSGVFLPVPVDGDAQLGNPSWSADGRSLLFTAASAAGMRVLRLDLANGDGVAEPVTDYGWVEAVETAHGLFARAIGREGVWRLSEDAEPELVFPELVAPLDSVSSRVSMRQWTVAADRIYGVDTTDPERPRVIARSVHGGPPEEVAHVGEDFLGSLAVDPRTGDVVYAALIDEQVDVGVMRFGAGSHPTARSAP